MEQGPKSQATSRFCSGGVSAVMGTSDLDASTFDSPGAAGNQLSCSLPFGWNRPNVKEACLDHVWLTWDGVRPAVLWPCPWESASNASPRSPCGARAMNDLIRPHGLESVALAISPDGRPLALLLVAAGFLGLLWLTQVLVRRSMDDGNHG